jgi:hypothetical protein
MLAVLACSAGEMVAGASTIVGVTPSSAPPNSLVRFSILCGTTAQAATLSGSVLGLPERIPMTKVSSQTGEFAASVTLPSSIQPGTYMPSIECDNGLSVPATLVVTPSGAPVTGDGTTTSATGGPLTDVGVGLTVAGGLIIVIWALWRRDRTRSGTLHGPRPGTTEPAASGAQASARNA